MEIEEFIEQDILVFLDRKLDKDDSVGERRRSAQISSVYLSRDYEEELVRALDEDNLSKAKHILHDLKNKFDEIPPGEDKRQVKVLLGQLYERFRAHVDGEEYGSEGQRSSGQDGAPAQGDEPGSPAEETSRVSGQQDHARKAQTLLAEAELALRREGVRLAIGKYREAKKEALRIEPHVPQQLAREFCDVHERIRAAIAGSSARPMQHDAHGGDGADGRDVVVEFEETRGGRDGSGGDADERARIVRQIDDHLFLQLERDKGVLDRQLHAHDIPGAVATYRRMRSVVQQIHDSRRAEDAAKKLLAIYKIINMVRDHTELNEQRLAGKMP